MLNPSGNKDIPQEEVFFFFSKANGVNHLDGKSKPAWPRTNPQGRWHGHVWDGEAGCASAELLVGRAQGRSRPGLQQVTDLCPLAGVRVQPEPLGPLRPPSARSLSSSPDPLAQYIPPGLKPSRSSSSSPLHPGLSGWSCSPGPGQSPPSIIHARAAPPPPPPRLPRRSEAERSGLCCAGRAPPPPARCPRSTGECCGRGIREEGSRVAPPRPWGAAGGDGAPPPSPAAGGRSWPGERGPVPGGRRGSAGGGAPWGAGWGVWWVAVEGGGCPREGIPRGSAGAGRATCGSAGMEAPWERGVRRGQGGGGRAGQCCGRAGERDGGRDGFGRGEGAAARRGDAAGPRGARAGPPAQQSGAAGTGCAFPPRGPCVAAVAGERSGTAVSHGEMSREERREMCGESPGDLGERGSRSTGRRGRRRAAAEGTCPGRGGGRRAVGPETDGAVLSWKSARQGRGGGQGGDPQPGLCGGCERGEGPCAPAGSALGTAALRRMPPASEEFPSERRCCRCLLAVHLGRQSAPARLARPFPQQRWALQWAGNLTPELGRRGSCGSKHGLCLLRTLAEEPLKKLPHRSVFQQRQSCGARAPLQFADKD